MIDVDAEIARHKSDLAMLTEQIREAQAARFRIEGVLQFLLAEKAKGNGSEVKTANAGAPVVGAV